MSHSLTSGTSQSSLLPIEHSSDSRPPPATPLQEDEYQEGSRAAHKHVTTATSNNSKPATVVATQSSSESQAYPPVPVQEHVCPLGKQKWQNKMTYAALIAAAIYSTPAKQLSIGKIYEFVEIHKFILPVFHPKWKNSIRHNLSLRKCFNKVPRRSPEGKRVRSYWRLDLSCMPVAAVEIVHILVELQQLATRTGSTIDLSRHCGWDAKEFNGIIQPTMLQAPAITRENGMLSAETYGVPQYQYPTSYPVGGPLQPGQLPPRHIQADQLLQHPPEERLRMVGVHPSMYNTVLQHSGQFQGPMVVAPWVQRSQVPQLHPQPQPQVPQLYPQPQSQALRQHHQSQLHEQPQSQVPQLYTQPPQHHQQPQFQAQQPYNRPQSHHQQPQSQAQQPYNRPQSHHQQPQSQAQQPYNRPQSHHQQPQSQAQQLHLRQQEYQ